MKLGQLGKIMGLNPNEFVRQLMAFPKVGPKIKEALAAGFTVEQIYKMFSDQPAVNSKNEPLGIREEEFGGVLPEAALQERAARRRTKLEKILDPRRLAKMGAGLALGYGVSQALGPVAGAVTGEILPAEEENETPTLPYEPPAQIGYQGGQPPQPEPQALTPIQPEISGQNAPSLVHEIGQGLDLGKLSPTQRKHFGALMATIKQLEEQGIPREDKRFKQALNQINKLKSGAMKEAPIMEEETARFEEVYPEGQQPVEEAPIQAEQIQETAPVEETQIGQIERIFPKVLSKEEEAKASRALTKYGLADYSRTPEIKINAEEIKGLDSASVKGASYDYPTKQLDVLFDNGDIYRYVNVPEETIDKVMKGATTKTGGRNRSRGWYKDKKESKGAGFDQFVKKAEFLKGKLDPKFVRDKALLDIKNADRITKTTDIFRPFYEIKEKAIIKQQLPDFREWNKEMDDLDDDAFAELYFMASEMQKQKGKKRTKPAMKKNLEMLRGKSSR